LLLVEDDLEMRSLLRDELCDLRCRIMEAADGDAALQQISRTKPDVIVTDLRMPAGGWDYVLRLRTFAPNCPIIVLTAFGDAVAMETARKCGVAAYFDKPVHPVVLKSAVARILDNHDRHGQTKESE
jgi:CheY-like chemotaxis protein